MTIDRKGQTATRWRPRSPSPHQPPLLSVPRRRSVARQIHDRFSGPGTEQVASEFAIAGLLRWLHRRCPERVLEVGAGVGTLTATILTYDPSVFLPVEDHAGCREACYANTGRMPVSSHQILALDWDMLVLDGGDGRNDDWNFAHRAIVFVEGGRRPQRAVLEASLRCRGRAFAHAQWKPLDRSKGFHVIALDPSLATRAWFAAVRAREAILDLAGRVLGYSIGKRRARASECTRTREREKEMTSP